MHYASRPTPSAVRFSERHQLTLAHGAERALEAHLDTAGVRRSHRTMRLFSIVGLCAAFASVFFLPSCSSESASSAEGVGTDDQGTNDDAPLPVYQSGSRLRAKQLLGTNDGALFVGWRDSTLDAACSFGWAEDGSFRCLPEGPSVGNTFSDPECKKRAIVVTPTCDVPAYARGEEICSSGSAVYKIGAKLTSGTIYVKQSSGSCSSGPANGLDLYDATAVVSPEDLVGGEPKTSKRTDNLGVVQIIAVDGAIETSSAFDTAHNGPCDAKSPIDGHCVPSNVAFEEIYFSDATCKKAAAIKSVCGDAPNAVVRSAQSTSSCGDDLPTFAQIGASLASTIYRGEGSCEEAKIAEGDSFYEIGSEISFGSFPQIESKEEGSGRIQVRMAATKSGDVLLGRTLYDKDRKEECAPTPAADKKMRCLPASKGRTDVRYFADSACEKPLAFVAEGCTAPAFVQLHTQLQTLCGEYTVSVFKVGTSVSPSTVYLNTSGTCEGTPPPSGTQFFDASEEVPSSEFAEIKTKTE